MIKITSNGSSPGTSITNEETGDEIRGISEIEWKVRGGWKEICELTMKVCLYNINVTVDESKATYVFDENAVKEISRIPLFVRKQLAKHMLEIPEK